MPRLRCVSQLVLACIVAGGCATKAGPILSPAELEAFGDAPAATLSYDKEVQFLWEGGEPIARVTEKSERVILTEAGRRYAHVYAGHDLTFSKLETMDVTVTDPSGDTKSYHLEDANDYPSAPDFVLFSDNRVAHINASALPLGSVVSSTIITRFTQPHLWTFRDTAQAQIPVVKNRFAASLPQGWVLEWGCTQSNAPCPVPDTARADGGEVMSAGLKAVSILPHAPPWHQTVPNLLVRLKTHVTPGNAVRTPFDDDRALSQWEHDLNKTQNIVSEKIKKQCTEILQGAPPSPEARARKLYSWVRDNISYCAIEVGIGGWQPHRSTETADVGYGDCKDKANLLQALLRADNIDSHMVSIYSHRGFPKDFTLPHPGWELQSRYP